MPDDHVLWSLSSEGTSQGGLVRQHPTTRQEVLMLQSPGSAKCALPRHGAKGRASPS